MSYVRDNIVMSRPAKANFGTTESTQPIMTLARRQACSWSMDAWFTDESSRRKGATGRAAHPNQEQWDHADITRRRLRTWWRASGSCLPHGDSMCARRRCWRYRTNSLWDVRGYVSKCAKSAQTPCKEEEEACIRKTKKLERIFGNSRRC